MLNWIPRFNLFFLVLIAFQILNGFNIIGNKNVHASAGVIELSLLLLVFSFIPFHIIALSKSTNEILDKNKQYTRLKKLVSKIKRASFYYTILGFLFILAVIVSGVGISSKINHKLFHTISVLILPIFTIYIFAKYYHLGSMLYRIEEKITL